MNQPIYTVTMLQESFSYVHRELYGLYLQKHVYLQLRNAMYKWVTLEHPFIKCYRNLYQYGQCIGIRRLIDTGSDTNSLARLLNKMTYIDDSSIMFENIRDTEFLTSHPLTAKFADEHLLASIGEYLRNGSNDVRMIKKYTDHFIAHMDSRQEEINDIMFVDKLHNALAHVAMIAEYIGVLISSLATDYKYEDVEPERGWKNLFQAPFHFEVES